VTVVAAAVLYLVWGQPGFFGDDFFVVMRSQADLSPARAIADVDARRAWVYETLTTHAEEDQADLRAWLDARGIPYTPYYLTNGIEVHASAIRRWQIARRDDVDRILYSPELRPPPQLPAPEPGLAAAPDAPTWGLKTIGVPRVWEEFGVRGEGIVVGQSDSGVEATHPALAGSYRGERMGSHDYNWYDPWMHRAEPYDSNGHGTHTLSTVLGEGGVGVAPEAEWFACANLVRAFGSPAYYLDCMQFMLAPWPQGGDPFRDGRPDLAADVSTNSWGCPPRIEGCDQEVLLPAVRALRAAGIFFVAAAGNEGPNCNSQQTPPGNYSNTILTVGALAPDGNLALFSSRGPETLSPDGARGPDLIAPGVDVLGAWPGGGWQRIEGTSMATPHVAGVVALMWSANPALRGEIEATEQILLDTTSPYQGIHDDCGDPTQRPEPSFGFGIVNAYEAVKRALAWTR
jgi:subtilisin family serine protease